MALADDLKSTVTQVFSSQWSTKDGTTVPDSPDIGLGNDAVKLNAVVLYADLVESTELVNKQKREMAAEVYKAYLHCAAKIIRAEGGEITAYDGDRIMAIFLGATKETSAARCALKINYAVLNIINPALVKQYGEVYTVRQVVGVDGSDLFVARTGIRGANDLVWVGPSANYAAKLCALREQGINSWITDAVYNSLADEAKTSNGKTMWEQRTWNGRTIYRSGWTWTI